MKKISIVILIFSVSIHGIYSQSLFGKKKDKKEATILFEVNKYENPFYKNNIGKVIFLANQPLSDDTNEKDILKDFEIKPGKGLWIKVITDNSLMNYGMKMYPEGNLDRWHTKLRYIFKFYLDGISAFQRESTPLLISEPIMDKETILSGTLIKLENQPDWATNPWELFVKESISKLTVGTHKLKIEIIPYMPYDVKEYFGDIVATGELNLIIKQNQFDAKTMCPQAKMKDIALEKSMIEAYSDNSKDGTPLKVVITEREWTNISTNTGVPHHRDIHAVLIFRKDGKCITKNGAFYQEFDGTKYGKIKFYNAMDGNNIPCDCLK